MGNIFFYIEPVAFRCDPGMLKIWADWVMRFIELDTIVRSGGFKFTIASSKTIIDHVKKTGVRDSCGLIEIRSWEILSCYDGRKDLYSQDLYINSEYEDKNIFLISFLEGIKNNLSPDLVFSFSQNRYIENIFKYSKIIFSEMAPLPRVSGRLSFFMDCRGHQANSLLASNIEDIYSINLDKEDIDSLIEIWNKNFVNISLYKSMAYGVNKWISSINKDNRPIVILALQPPDWITYEGAYENVSPEALVMRWLSDLPSDWIAIPTYPPLWQMPPEMEDAILQDFPQFYPLPKHLRNISAELLIPFVDAIVTISSSVGMTGLLDGKCVISCGTSALSRFTIDSIEKISRKPNLDRNKRAKLMAFLSNKYCHPLEDCLYESGYMNNLFQSILYNKMGIESYFDFSEWSPDCLTRLLYPKSS